MPGGFQRRHRVEGRRGAHRGIAAAMDHLLDLDEELDLPDTAAPALEVEARPDLRALGIMVADSRRNLAHVLDHPEIERAAPHERLDRRKEALAQRPVAGGGPRADEGRPLPRQSRGFIVGNGGIDGEGDRRDLGRRAEPQIDPRDIAVGGSSLEDFDQPPADPDGRFAGSSRSRRGRVAGSNSRSKSTSEE